MSISRNPSPVDKARIELRHAFRLCVGAALATLALWSPQFATAAPAEVRTPEEVRTQPNQFIVVAVANPVTGRPAAVGGTAHGYGTTSNYRVSASATSLIRAGAQSFAHAGVRVADRTAADALRAVPDSAGHHA